MFAPVLNGLRIRRPGPGRPRSRPDRVRGDKAYSSRDNRAYLRRRGIKATIAHPDDQRLHRKRRGRTGDRPPAFDKAQYRRRDAVERCVNKGKQFRAVATRYDKRDYIFNDNLTVAAIVIWLRDIVQEPSETDLGRSPSTIPRETSRSGGRAAIEPPWPMQPPTNASVGQNGPSSPSTRSDPAT